MVSPKIAKLLGIYMLDKDASLFYMNIVRQTLKNRRETGARRNDIIDLFIDELDKEREDCFLPGNDLELGIIATAILFFFAGFDTTSTTLGLTVFGLVHHPEVQDNLRKEIEDVIGDSEEVTADHLKELKYTENVINESLRRYFRFREYLQHFVLTYTCNDSGPEDMLQGLPRPGHRLHHPQGSDGQHPSRRELLQISGQLRPR